MTFHEIEDMWALCEKEKGDVAADAFAQNWKEELARNPKKHSLCFF